MPVDTNQIDELPPLAYLAEIDASGCCLWHGASVHIGTEFLADGLWSGPLASGPTVGQFITGTSLRWTRTGEYVLIAGQSPMDRVYIVEDGTRMVVSNSLAFLCEHIDRELRPTDFRYRARLTSLVHGLRIGPRTIPLEGGIQVRMLVAEELRIDASGRYHSRKLPPDNPQGFPDYVGYYGHLRERLAQLCANALDEGRSHRYEAIVPLSSGYDSTATASLACSLGFRDAITMLRYNPQDPTVPVDHPQASAEALGMRLLEVPRDTWRTRTDLPEAPVAAGMSSFIDIPLLALVPYAGGRLVLSGDPGDVVWQSRKPQVYRDMMRTDTGGQAWGEARLRANMMWISVPYIGHLAQPDIAKISNSEQMKPFSIDGPYDRPIPKRIAEEAGVPRDTFGQKKYGGSALVGDTRVPIPFGNRDQRRRALLGFLSEHSAERFEEFFADIPTPSRRVMRAQRGAFWFYEKLNALNYRVARRTHSLGVKGAVPRVAMAWMATYASVRLDAGAWLAHWGVHECRSAYRGLSRVESP